MLDTNVCIALIKQAPAKMLRKLQSCQAGDVGISSITLAELRFGADKSMARQKNHQALDEFVLPLDIASFDELAAQYYGLIRTDLERKGTPIGSLDTLIGAHALSLSTTLVTNNTREFTRIPGLTVVNWQ
jgi:tRNA(fMet)-specific endonuclease VapC